MDSKARSSHDLPFQPPDERSIAEWSVIAASARVEGPVEVFVTQEGPRFYLCGERVYWLASEERVVETLEHGDSLAWRTLDRTGRELDGGVCSSSFWATGDRGDRGHPPWPRATFAGSSR